MPRSNVVITGIGVVSSIGIGCDSFFQGLLEKRSGITSLAQRTDDGAKPDGVAEPAGLWVGGPILDFDAKQYVTPRKALKVMCREIQTAFAASSLAVESAGLIDSLPATEGGEILPGRIGTVFGSEMLYGPPQEMEDTIRACLSSDGCFDASKFGANAMKQIIPLWMLKYLPNMPACHVGIALNAQGPNNSVILGDVSGPAAVIEAISYIQRGLADYVIAGATGTRISTTRLNYRGDLPLSEAFNPIECSSRPHDPKSKGVVGGEGAAALVLETESQSRKRGSKPIARILAYANRFYPACSLRRPLRSREPNDIGARGSSKAIRLAIDAALSDAEISADAIGLIISHGMGDPSSDTAEREAIEETGLKAPMVATIASLGHVGAASGTFDLLTGAMALQMGIAPPTLVAPSVKPNVRLLQSPQPLRSDYVLCLSHTPEGNAIATILTKARH